MRALSLWQPWASLVALDRKHVETRSWPIKWLGRLAIHATASIPLAVRDWLSAPDPDFAAKRICEALAERGIDSLEDLPLGKVLCTVEVIGCKPTWELVRYVTEDERAFGDFRPDRFGIILANVLPVIPPAAAKGKPGIWDWRRGSSLATSH